MSITPTVRFDGLETLWFQVAGTLCNIECTHCFISCGPKNDALKMMSLQHVEGGLREARELGVREIYFTGGEPFLHPRMLDILEMSLRDFPTTVLTNGMLVLDRTADRLAELSGNSPYSLELRVSLEDTEPERNDSVRGKGAFEKAVRGIKRLEERGLLPIVTVTEIFVEPEPVRKFTRDPSRLRFQSQMQVSAHQRFAEFLKSMGVKKPRIKFLPVFAMGGLAQLEQPPLLTPEMMEGFDHSLLQCSAGRVLAADGAYVCPILVGQENARMSAGPLAETLHEFPLYHSACTTCYLTGMTCSNR